MIIGVRICEFDVTTKLAEGLIFHTHAHTHLKPVNKNFVTTLEEQNGNFSCFAFCRL